MMRLMVEKLEDIEDEEELYPVYNMDKLWDALHFLLTGKHLKTL